MAAFSDYAENLLIDGIFRNTNTPTIAGWAATTAITVGTVVTSGASMTGAGGKFLRCTTAGTTGSTTTLAVPAVGSTLVDGSVTWTAVTGVPAYVNLYVGLFTTTPNADTAASGVEVSAGTYARVLYAASLANWAATQNTNPTGTTAVSSGSGGTTFNSGVITFNAPSGTAWTTINGFGIWDAPSGGNLLIYGGLSSPKTVNATDSAPSFAIGALTFQVDN
jgi:hypothetical protein